MVFELNRIYIGTLILLFFIVSYFLKLDYFVLLIISTLVVYDLYKSKFIKNFIYLLSSILFLLISFLIGIKFNFINFLNIFLILLTLIIILRSSFYNQIIFLIIILFFLNNFYSLLNNNRDLLFFLIFISFFNDSLAYTCGKLIKGPLIIPSISPKKTWSGTLLSIFASGILIHMFNYPLFISFLLSVSLFFGDIFFSYVKRINGIKDFSNILKGHGGILDRLDSMFFFIIILNFYT